MIKKSILITCLLISGLVIGIYIHSYLVHLVLDTFRFSTNNNIRYIGKGIIIPSPIFLISFSISFTILLFSILSEKNKRIINSLKWVLIFFLTIIIFSSLKANLDLTTCTACDDGILRIRHFETGYWFILSIASICSLIPNLITLLKKKTKNKDKFI